MSWVYDVCHGSLVRSYFSRLLGMGSLGSCLAGYFAEFTAWLTYALSDVMLVITSFSLQKLITFHIVNDL